MKDIGFLSFGCRAPESGSQARSASDSLLQSIDLAVAAEEIGLDGTYFRVHHFARQLASPFPLLAAVGARTSKIGIGAGVIDMRYENPLCMVEDAGTADMISDGRLQHGISRGSPEQVIDGWKARASPNRIPTRCGQPSGPPAAGAAFPGLRKRIWWNAGSDATAVWAAKMGMNLQSSTQKNGETGKPFNLQQAKQIRAYREAWAAAGHAPMPHVSVGRSIFALMNNTDRMYFGRGKERDRIVMIDAQTRTIFDRGYAADPDSLVE